MEFRMIYKGPLKAEGSDGGNTKQKQEIRKEFHKQLRELWKQHPDLRSQAESRFFISDRGEGERHVVPVPREQHLEASNVKTWVQHIADDHERFGYKFVPLISKAGGFTCALDILFLRRDNPGYLIRDGGDIDNRIKTLFDGLKMPGTVGQLGGYDLPDSDENPFFCLLEDDSLITKVAVTTDRLLTSLETNEKVTHVHLIIHVTMTNPSAIFAGNRLV